MYNCDSYYCKAVNLLLQTPSYILCKYVHRSLQLVRYIVLAVVYVHG